MRKSRAEQDCLEGRSERPEPEGWPAPTAVESGSRTGL